MICWKCGHVNEETRQFCEKCGADIWHADPVPNRQQQDRNQQNGNQQSGDQQNVIWQNVNHSEYRQTGADYGTNQTQPPSENNRSASEVGKSGLIKIAALIFAALYLIKALMFIPSVFATLGGILAGRHIVVSVIGLAFLILWMMSFVLLAGALALLALRRTEENQESLYLLVVLAEALHIIVSMLLLIWNIILMSAIYRREMPAKVFLSEFAILLFAFLVLALLFVLFSKEGQKPLLGKNRDEIKRMINDLPVILQAEAENISANFASSRENKKNDYGEKISPQPSYAVAGPLKTNWGLLKLIVFNFLTCGIYIWYFYYAVARDINTICEGDGEETAGLIKHILLTLVTCGIYEYIWQCQFADRLRRNASRYGVTIQENGTTVILWMFPGSCCCGIGAFVAYHIQTKNLNKLAKAYNEKVSGRFGANI